MQRLTPLPLSQSPPLHHARTHAHTHARTHARLKVRPGVLRLIEEARALGEAAPKLAICSASTKTSCLFVLDNLLGPGVLQHFHLILAGDDVQRRKPDPEIYRLASER